MMGHRARALAKALKNDKTIKKVPNFECYDKALISLTTHRKPQSRIIKKKEETESRLFPFLL